MKKGLELLSVAVFLFLSCSKDVNNVSSYIDNELGVSACTSVNSISTRSIVESDVFAAGSSVGVFVSGIGYIRKVSHYTYDGSVWNHPPNNNDRIYLTDEIATVYGFYPADAALLALDADATHKIEINIDSVASLDGSDQNDYMYASAGYASDAHIYPLATASYTQGPRTVNLYFHHTLTKLVFIVNKKYDYTGTGVVSKIILEGKNDKCFLAGPGTMNVANGGINVTKQSSTLTFTGSTNMNDGQSSVNVTAKTLALPLSSTTDISIYLVVDGTKMKATLPSDSPADKWEAGKQYTYTLIVSGTELSMGSVTILDWDEIPGGDVEVN